MDRSTYISHWENGYNVFGKNMLSKFDRHGARTSWEQWVLKPLDRRGVENASWKTKLKEMLKCRKQLELAGSSSDERNTPGQWPVAQAKSQVKWPGKTQARAKAGESGLPKLKPGPQATLGHSLLALAWPGFLWLASAGFQRMGWAGKSLPTSLAMTSANLAGFLRESLIVCSLIVQSLSNSIPLSCTLGMWGPSSIGLRKESGWVVSPWP